MIMQLIYVVWFYNHSFYFLEDLCALALIQLTATSTMRKILSSFSHIVRQRRTNALTSLQQSH